MNLNEKFECKFCNKILSTKANLKSHQTKAKYCLEKQNIISTNELCQYCNRYFSTKQSRNIHESLCVGKEICERYNTIMNDQKEQIQKLKMEIDKLKSEKEIYNSLFKTEHEFVHKQAEKSSVTNNIKSKNVNMNSLNLSQERLLSIKDSYTLNHYERGGIGQADWVTDNVLKDEGGNLIYKCTDKNRKSFLYKDEKGEIVSDIHAKKLKEAILPIMTSKLKEYKKIKCNELIDIDDDDSELMDKYNELYVENKSLGSEFDKRLVEKTYG